MRASQTLAHCLRPVIATQRPTHELLSVRQPAYAVLDDHHRAVNDDPEIQRAQTHEIGADLILDHAGESNQHCQWNDGGGNDRGTQIAQKDKQHDDDEHGEDDRERALDEGVEDDLVHVGRALGRGEDLARVTRGTGQAELDNALSARRSGAASIEAARANLEKTRLNLSYTKITSPIDGTVLVLPVIVALMMGSSMRSISPSMRSEPFLFTVTLVAISLLLNAGWDSGSSSERRYLALFFDCLSGLTGRGARSLAS